MVFLMLRSSKPAEFAEMAVRAKFLAKRAFAKGALYSTGPLNSFCQHLLNGPSVAVSTSQNIFTNLALEDWIYRNCDFSGTTRPLLLLWRNRPCVVIGRHQNPWTECKLFPMNRHNIALARRNSGGGTVYHDLGNLNCTFFTERSKYDRKSNLDLICAAVRSRWPIDVRVSAREDIVLDGLYKISGTAAKLGRTTAYHHCTLLIDVDKSHLSGVLRTKDIQGLESKATRSVRSAVKNLSEVIPGAKFEDLVDVIVQQFSLRYRGLNGPLRPVYFSPSDFRFPGLTDLERQIKSWDWIFGKCPSFKLERELSLPLMERADDRHIVTKITVKVGKGIVEEVSLIPNYWLLESSRKALGNLVGKRFPCHKSDFDTFLRVSLEDDHETTQIIEIQRMLLNSIEDLF